MTEENSSKEEKQTKVTEEKNVFLAEITSEMEKAYIDYAMSVIVARALPAVEDGLKPVHRRILYAMELMGLKPGSQTKKSARIVGDVIGKLHPHGDVAVYDALVRMAQNFSLRYPLIIGQGNFGSLDGDPPAAYRYTEAKLSPISMELLEDLDKETVDFIPNFDNSLQEPLILPAKLPNLLINGSSGIAVGMTTNIPPHNLTEVCDAIVRYIEKPSIEIEKIAEIIKGPDFPTGGLISGDILEIYKTGRGRVIVRGRVTIEDAKEKLSLVITEIPYMLNKSDLISSIAKLVQEKKLPDITDIKDESARGNVRIVIELKKGADPKFTINRLYKFTRLQDNFDVNLVALVKGKPQTLDLKKIIENYVRHRKEVVERRCKFDLRKAKERLEIVLGLLIALKNLDLTIQTIKKSKNPSEALENLVEKLSLTKRQAQAILEMRLSSLTTLEHDKLRKEEQDLKEKIKDLERILSSEVEILNVVRKEVLELKRKYGDERRTQLLQRVREIEEKDIVQKKQVVISITDKGYIKRTGLKDYKEQKRGGKGVIGSDLSTGDFVKQLLTCSSHDYLLFFTNKGRVYWLKAYQTPELERYGKGKALINLLNLKDESVQSVLPISEFKDFVLLVTKKGQIKKMNLSNLSKPRATGVRVINLPEDYSDTVVDVKPIKDEEILLVTTQGQAIRFRDDDVREMGRAAYGVAGIKLDKNDEVVSMEILSKENDLTILTITEKGFGKRSRVEDYRITRRAGKGVINLKVGEKTGKVITTSSVKDKDSVIITTAKGMIIRTPVKGLRVIGRATQGVRVVKLQVGDKVTDLIKIQEIEEENGNE